MRADAIAVRVTISETINTGSVQLKNKNDIKMKYFARFA